MEVEPLAWQPSLLDQDAPPGVDVSFEGLRRFALDESSWVDYCPGWLVGHDALFETLLSSGAWQQRTRQMYDKKVLEPRLTAPWNARSGEELKPPLLEDIRVALSEHYAIELDSVGFNLYRDGRDSVAWHGDRIGRGRSADTMVAIVSFGSPRPLMLRPAGGGESLRFPLGHGDLAVMGGSCQRTWEHCIPKTTKPVGPRVSVQYRPRGVA